MMEIIITLIEIFFFNKSYQKITNNRIESFFADPLFQFENFNKNDYIELKFLGAGFLFSCTLAYHIEKEILIVIKKKQTNHIEFDKLLKRETYNYTKIRHPFISKFYGKTVEDEYLVIEFIKDQTLLNIKNLHLKDIEKIKIIFELMLIIKYIHDNHFIYRDLKPRNIIINNSNNIVLIDFDRMLFFDYLTNDTEITKDFGSNYFAPEINEGCVSYSCDIYSLCMVIYYIIEEKVPDSKIIQYVSSNGLFANNSVIHQIFRKCINKNHKGRPSISEIINEFYQNYHSKIKIDNLSKIYDPNNNIKKSK